MAPPACKRPAAASSLEASRAAVHRKERVCGVCYLTSAGLLPNMRLLLEEGERGESRSFGINLIPSFGTEDLDSPNPLS